MKIHTIILLLAITASSSGCAGGNTADERLRAIFSIAPSVSLDETNIRVAVLKVIPIGTPATEVGQKLQSVGVGDATISAYYTPSDGGIGTIRIDYDPTTFGLVKKSYMIHLAFDGSKKLSSVKVEIGLTGL